MSRYYRVHIECIGKITERKLSNIMVKNFGWKYDAGTWTRDKNIIAFAGEGSLCGGQSEEEAHEELVTYLKTIDPKIKVETTWTYLEDLPTNTYGGLE